MILWTTLQNLSIVLAGNRHSSWFNFRNSQYISHVNNLIVQCHLYSREHHSDNLFKCSYLQFSELYFKIFIHALSLHTSPHIARYFEGNRAFICAGGSALIEAKVSSRIGARVICFFCSWIGNRCHHNSHCI